MLQSECVVYLDKPSSPKDLSVQLKLMPLCVRTCTCSWYQVAHIDFLKPCPYCYVCTPVVAPTSSRPPATGSDHPPRSAPPAATSSPQHQVVIKEETPPEEITTSESSFPCLLRQKCDVASLHCKYIYRIIPHLLNILISCAPQILNLSMRESVATDFAT